MNILAILLCAVWAMISGYLWYSPMLFEKPWMKLVGLTNKDMKMSQNEMAKMYGTTVLLNIVAALLLSTFSIGNGNPVDNALLVTIWLVIFTLIPSLITNLFNRKPLALTLINVGYQFVSFIGFAVILSFFGA